MAIFGPNPWVNFSTFSTSCFYSLERRFFVLEYCKRHFPGLQCLKKKSWKNGHFSTKTMGYPLWKKIQFFDFLNFLFLQPRKEFFSFQNIVKDIFLAYNAKKKLEKWPFSDENHGLSPFRKMLIFRLFKLLVFISQKFAFWRKLS